MVQKFLVDLVEPGKEGYLGRKEFLSRENIFVIMKHTSCFPTLNNPFSLTNGNRPGLKLRVVMAVFILEDD